MVSRFDHSIRLERTPLESEADIVLVGQDVLDWLSQLFVHRGVPQYIRSDNGAEFTARAVQEWLQALQVQTLYIEPGSPWEKDYASHCTSCVESDTTLG